MMTRIVVLFVVGVCCVLAEESEFATTELPKRYSDSEDRLPTNIIHVTNSSQLTPNKSNEEDSKKTDKKPRTAVIHRDSSHDSRDNSSCCGSNRYSSNGSARPDYHYNKIPLGTGRFPEYGERHPVDRYGWQTQGRPPGSTGSSSRPGGGGGGGGGGANGGYSGNGVYAGSHSGDRYGLRPVYGSESSNRPSTLGYGSGNGGHGGNGGYGGYGRPTGYGGYGISGTLADGDEFGPGDLEGSMPQPPGNLHTQKAVALKALAGVALIGAAAALASNPVLLPIGIVSGRKKRSETFPEETLTDYQMEYILNTLKRNLAQIQRDSSTNRLVVSPRCVARLTCEIQKEYLSDLDKDTEFLDTNRKYYLVKLLQKNVLGVNSVNANVKSLIKFAVGVASENKNCDVFACNYIRKG